MDYQAHLNRKLEILFPNARDRLKAKRLLADHGLEDIDHEPPRVRLAVLKLAGADFKQIKNFAELAKIDLI